MTNEEKLELLQEKINKNTIILAKQMQDNPPEIEIFKCPVCKKFIAVPKIAYKTLKKAKKNLKLACPYCEQKQEIELIKKKPQNEEQYEAFERDLVNWTEANPKPIINICCDCMFPFLSFEKDVNNLKHCPLCFNDFEAVGDMSAHVSIPHKISDKLIMGLTPNETTNKLQAIEDIAKEEQVLNNKVGEDSEDFEEREFAHYISLENLVSKYVSIITSENKTFSGYFVGFNPTLEMVILAIQKQKSNDFTYHWIALKTITRIKEG